MNSSRRFLLRSLILRPSVLLPMIGGIAAGVASFAVGGSVLLTSAAIVGVVGSVAWVATRALLNVEELTQQAIQADRQGEREAYWRQLKQLAKQLRTDRDHRTQDTLSLLRSLSDEFEQLTSRPGFELRSARFREQVGQVVEASVGQLQESYRLFERSEAVVGDARDSILKQREAVVSEVVGAVDRLQSIVQQFREITREDQDADLKSLQNELDISLDIAKRTDERMRELENPTSSYDSLVKE